VGPRHICCVTRAAGHWDRPALAYRFHAPSFSHALGAASWFREMGNHIVGRDSMWGRDCECCFDGDNSLLLRKQRLDDYILAHALLTVFRLQLQISKVSSLLGKLFFFNAHTIGISLKITGAARLVPVLCATPNFKI
jgi:hypothetical protein